VLASALKGPPDCVSSLSGPASAGIRPVIHGPAPEGRRRAAMVSRCLSAAGIRFSVILSRLVFRPSYDRPTGAAAPDHDGVPAFRTRKIRPDWAPSLSRDQRCSHRPGAIPGPPPAASQRHGPVPQHICHLSGAMPHETSDEGSSLRPPGLPLTCGPRMARAALGLFPGLRTRADRTRARTPGRGQALSTSPELRRWRHASPPICEFTRIHVRHRVALALTSPAPDVGSLHQLATGARRRAIAGPISCSPTE
jgi:hypothetical protein